MARTRSFLWRPGAHQNTADYPAYAETDPKGKSGFMLSPRRPSAQVKLDEHKCVRRTEH